MRIGRYESSESSNLGTAITFLLIGLGAGALVGLLLAPKSGKQLRRDLQRGYEDAKDAVGDWADEAKDKVREATDRVRDAAIAPRVVHQHVEPAEPGHGVVDHRGDLCRVGDVGLDNHVPVAGQARRDRRGERRVVAVMDGDTVPGPGERFRDRLADAAGRPSYQNLAISHLLTLTSGTWLRHNEPTRIMSVHDADP